MVLSPKLPPPINPALLSTPRSAPSARQNRIADTITRFAGSMLFVYLHVIWFGCWIGFGVESYPYGLLTMIVSLEAIFLSTFVMISQNRADAKRQVIADQQWQTVQEEDKQNEELLDLSKQILELTKAIHAAHDEGREPPGQPPPRDAVHDVVAPAFARRRRRPAASSSATARALRGLLDAGRGRDAARRRRAQPRRRRPARDERGQAGRRALRRGLPQLAADPRVRAGLPRLAARRGRRAR